MIISSLKFKNDKLNYLNFSATSNLSECFVIYSEYHDVDTVTGNAFDSSGQLIAGWGLLELQLIKRIN